MTERLRLLFSRIVFWFRTRRGFRLLGPVSVTGTVRYVEVAEDGDTCFGLAPDSLIPLGYQTKANGGTVVYHRCEEMHCEVMPADRQRLSVQLSRLHPGLRVRVTGQRAWDGSHHGRGVLFDALMCLLGAAPTVDGWIEIHPVTDLEVLG